MSIVAERPSAERPSRFRRWWVDAFAGLLRVALRRWYLFVLLLAIWALALVRLFGPHTPVLPVVVNWTPSLPYRLLYVDYHATRYGRGDLVIYSFSGIAAANYPGLLHQPFFKRVAGLPGDIVTVRGREVQVNGVVVGIAKTHTFDRRPLRPIAEGIIPPGYVYVQGTSPDSFDSRYAESGLVPLTDVRGKAHPLL